MKRDIRIERVFHHPPAKVWRAIADREAIAAWLMKNDFEPRVGHRFQLRDRPRPGWDGVCNCEVLVCDPERKLSYSWVGGPLDTVVTWTLEPVPEGTRLVLEHTGFTGLFAVAISHMMGRGWKKMLDRRLDTIIAADGGWSAAIPARC
jgi:uncharacterized protein YndB with AHSA1/START domain